MALPVVSPETLFDVIAEAEKQGSTSRYGALVLTRLWMQGHDVGRRVARMFERTFPSQDALREEGKVPGAVLGIAIHALERQLQKDSRDARAELPTVSPETIAEVQEAIRRLSREVFDDESQARMDERNPHLAIFVRSGTMSLPQEIRDATRSAFAEAYQLLELQMKEHAVDEVPLSHNGAILANGRGVHANGVKN
jgi:hypothetical protein